MHEGHVVRNSLCRGQPDACRMTRSCGAGALRLTLESKSGRGESRTSDQGEGKEGVAHRWKGKEGASGPEEGEGTKTYRVGAKLSRGADF